MTKDEYIDIAVNKTIGFLRDQGLKYRRMDFEHDNYVHFIGGGVTVVLRFDFGERGKKLKALKDHFLNYISARVLDNEVRFSFTAKELELESLKTIPADDNVDLDKIMDKITKLLARTKSPYEAEAISASMMVQKLLAKYNLDIEAVTGQPKTEAIDQCISDVGTGNKWKYGLAEALARSYCCRVYYHGSEQIVFYGYKSDIIIARRVFFYLYEVGNRLARAYSKEQREIYGEAQGIYNSFCAGFVRGVDEQLSKHCKALMLITPKEVNDSFKTFSEKFSTFNPNINTSDEEAYQNGKVEGARALNAQYIEG